MPAPLKLSRADAKRALATHHFSPCASQMDVFSRLRSIQFDPIAPVGCNHDLVLQARVSGYRVGDWEKTAYEDRLIYDGWDKQASLVPFEGWPLRRIIHAIHAPKFRALLDEYPEATASILKNLEERGPLLPKDCEFQASRTEWKSHWYSPNVTKRILRALWHCGTVMTAGRRKGQHVYDLAERVVPPHLYREPHLPEADAKLELMLERHRAAGMIRPSASAEMWSYGLLYYGRHELIGQLVDQGDLIALDVDGMKAHATPAFLAGLDSPPTEPRVKFVAPLDQLLWDRKLLQQLFAFDYAWEIYVPEAKRRWGYYVLPIWFDGHFPARAEFWARDGALEIRRWHWEDGAGTPAFHAALQPALRNFMAYCKTGTLTISPDIDRRTRDFVGAALR